MWVSEAPLWTAWMHRGVLTANSNCRLLSLDAGIFQATVGRFHHLDYDPRQYAAEFVEQLNNNIEEVTDLPFDHQIRHPLTSASSAALNLVIGAIENKMSSGNLINGVRG